MKQIKLSQNQVKAIELNILIKFANFCDKHNLKYYLAYGTLLGSIRHKGFIPWDDDIDVMMLREDYDKLCNILSHDCIAEELDWCCIENGKWNEPFGKVFNVNTRAYLHENKGGLWIDVFPMDYYDENILSRNIFWRKVHIAKTTKHFGFDKKSLGKFALKVLYFWKSLNKISTNMRSRALTAHPSDYYSNLVWESFDCKPLPKEWFEKTCEVEFENHSFKTVSEWDKCLKLLYGNYMELPPVEKRQSHSMDAYWISDEPCNY